MALAWNVCAQSQGEGDVSAADLGLMAAAIMWITLQTAVLRNCHNESFPRPAVFK